MAGESDREKANSIREALTSCDEFKLRAPFKLGTGPVALCCFFF